MDSDSITQLLLVFALLLCSAFFSSAETALSMVNKVRLMALRDEGNKRAETALKVVEDYSGMLSAILIGNNIVNLYASAIVTTIAMKIGFNVGIATLILTIVILLLCEILPKNISAIKSEKLALFYAGFINLIMKLMTPVVFIVNGISSLFLKMLKLDINEHESMTESELRTYVDESHKDGVIESEEKEMIINVFEFGDSVAKDVMIPRVDMVTVSETSTLEDILSVFREHMYTRLPVCETESESIVGFINIKDILKLDEKTEFNVDKIMRKPFFTIEYRNTADLLSDMRKERASVAFVLNEYGGCEGMITLEDLLEEIVGEIRDEYDADEEDLIQKMGEREYLIEGSMKLDDINTELDTNLHSDDYDSIAGLLIEYLEDRLPEDGDMIVTREGYELRVMGMEQNRVKKVILKVPAKEEENEGEESLE